jgi:hypothetical protein
MASIYSFASMGVTVPDSVKRLVDRFDRDRKAFLSPDYKEEQLRAGLPAVPRSSFGVRTFLGPVIHEESIKACPELGRRVAGATKAPDYTFRIGGRRVLVRARSMIDKHPRTVILT